MLNNVFGEMVFDDGWETKFSIMLWGKNYEITVDAEAYEETDGITAEQEESFGMFKKLQLEKQERIELLLLQYFGNRLDTVKLRDRLTPESIIVEQAGRCAMLFDDKEDPDNGIAVVFFPEEKVMTQDEYF